MRKFSKVLTNDTDTQMNITENNASNNANARILRAIKEQEQQKDWNNIETFDSYRQNNPPPPIGDRIDGDKFHERLRSDWTKMEKQVQSNAGLPESRTIGQKHAAQNPAAKGAAIPSPAFQAVKAVSDVTKGVAQGVSNAYAINQYGEIQNNFHNYHIEHGYYTGFHNHAEQERSNEIRQLQQKINIGEALGSTLGTAGAAGFALYNVFGGKKDTTDRVNYNTVNTGVTKGDPREGLFSHHENSVTNKAPEFVRSSESDSTKVHTKADVHADAGKTPPDSSQVVKTNAVPTDETPKVETQVTPEPAQGEVKSYPGTIGTDAKIEINETRV